MQPKISVGILGATGIVGQKFIALLEHHPWFKITDIVASQDSAGKIYSSIVRWREKTLLYPEVGNMRIKDCYAKLQSQILLSGLDANIAGSIEEQYTKLGHIVISNSSNHRMDRYVPLVIPEVNASHFQIIKQQCLENSKFGFIVTNPNCSVMILAIALFPIHKKYQIDKIIVTTMQSISGAGYPGVASIDILGNIIPFISGEEEKIESELLKLFGKYNNNKINFANIKISAACNRVPVTNGHTLSISFSTKKKIKDYEIIDAIQKFKGLTLPSSPKNLIKYFDDPCKPQPLFDTSYGNGMVISMGNLRPCKVLDWKITALGNNTIRGAAGTAILNAEYIVNNNFQNCYTKLNKNSNKSSNILDSK